MQKKRDFHILVVVELTILLIVSIFIILHSQNIKLTGFAIYESASDGSTINDTYLRETSPNNNYGVATTLRIGNISTGGGTEYRVLIKDYNISSIDPGDTIVDAKLQVYVEDAFGSSNITIKAYRVTSEWIESQATWNNRTTSTAWSTAGGDYLEEIDALNFSNATGVYYNFTLTTIVRGWVNGSYTNYGIILLSTDAQAGNYTYLSSSDSATASQRPKFIIDHSPNVAPQIINISTDSSLTSPIQVGSQVNITVNWTDLEGQSGQLFVCNSSNINQSGCNEKTLCNTSFQSSGPSSCLYTVLSTDNRTTPFWISVCDSANCSDANQSQFYMNHAPTVLVTDPNGGEIINQSQGNYTIKFNVSDSDSDTLTADIYYGSTQNSTTNIIVSDYSLTCTDPDNDNSTANNCSYSWNSSGIYGTYFLTIIINDSTITSNDSSDSSFSIRSLTDNTPPNITSQWIDSDISSGEQIQIYANVSEPNINTVWVSINTTPQVNLTMSNSSDEITYNITWIAAAPGNYQFKVYANDTVGNINDTTSWQIFSISTPNATIQNVTAPSTALPYHTIKVTAQINATDPLRNVYAYLNTPNGFTFLSNYSQNISLGNFTYNQTKKAEWFLSTPIDEATYILNVTFSDYYSDQWNSSNIQIQVTSAIGGYEISMTGYPEVETSGTYFAQAYFKQNGIYTDPDLITISVYDATGSLTWGPATMTKESTGIYNYSNTVGASATEGQWESIVNSTKSSVSYYTHEFWKVVGGPFDVRDINIIDSTIPTLNISVVTENTGGANKDLTLTWNLTRIDTNTVLDSGSETFMVSANSERTWYVEPSTTYIGQVKITFLGYYSGTEKAGAYTTFTTTSEAAPTPTPSAGGRGGGGIIEKISYDFEIDVEKIVYLTRNIEKIIYLEITNTGEKWLRNIYLELEGLNKEFYSIFPSKITSLEPGDSQIFEIKFYITDFIGEHNFNYLVKTKDVSKKEPGKIIVLTMTDYFIREIERLKQKIDDIKTKTKDKKLIENLEICENILKELESNLEKEEFIDAKANLNRVEDCIDNVEDKIKEEISLPEEKINYTVWVITWILLVLLIIALAIIIYILYKKLTALEYFKKIQTKKLPKPSKEQYLENKIKKIEEKLNV